jgi:hypothetical protein
MPQQLTSAAVDAPKVPPMISSPTVLLGPPLIGFLFQETHNFTSAFGSIMLFGFVAITASFLAGPAVKRETSLS